MGVQAAKKYAPTQANAHIIAAASEAQVTTALHEPPESPCISNFRAALDVPRSAGKRLCSSNNCLANPATNAKSSYRNVAVEPHGVFSHIPKIPFIGSWRAGLRDKPNKRVHRQ